MTKRLSARDVEDGWVLVQQETAQPICTFEHAHQERIHSLLALNNSTFITGSQDGILKQWNHQGRFVKIMPTEAHEITALAPFGADRWVSGTPERHVDLWDKLGQHVASCDPFPAYNTSSSRKPKGFERVLSLLKLYPKEEDPTFLVGWPSQFTVHQTDTTMRISNIETHPNHEVSSMTLLSERKVAVVTGPHWEVFEPKDTTLKRWQRTATLLKEKELSAFISSATPLEENPHHFGLSLFHTHNAEANSILLYDVQAEKPLFAKPGHAGKPRKIEALSPQEFASCGDDGTIKIWDLRTQAPTKSWTDPSDENMGVSCILKLSEHLLVSAACPDPIEKSRTKACLHFWDLRKV